MSILGPAGFDPPGFEPPGYSPPAAAVEVLDLDYDLVAFLAKVLGFYPSPVAVPPATNAPSASYTLVADVSTTRLAGIAGLARRTYQLDFRALDPAAPNRLAERTRLAVQAIRGPFGTNTVRRATYRRLPLGYDQAANGGSSGTFRVAAEVAFWYRQAHPAP